MPSVAVENVDKPMTEKQKNYITKMAGILDRKGAVYPNVPEIYIPLDKLTRKEASTLIDALQKELGFDKTKKDPPVDKVETSSEDNSKLKFTFSKGISKKEG